MELQVSHSVCTKIQKVSNIWKNKEYIEIIRIKLCEWKGVEIIEAEACPDHIHMLVEIPPKISVSSFMGYLKGKSSLMIFDQHANMKYKYGDREFWCRGYYECYILGKPTSSVRV
ncbi:transposase IS200 like protein [Clostridium oryzae]|uniref:Transposase IS200 like protein n=1 Tax=Clostridium oryzae TaxID=1450648 RepID=A0A1V4IJM1_9CLOT|nr:transposase IS200 like protein [Clostridium oryzae]